MNLRFKRKFIWSASIGFFLWFTGLYLYHYQLKYQITEDDVKKFEKSYQEKCVDLEDDLKEFLIGIETRKTEIERFEFAKQYSQQAHTDFFIYEYDTLILWTTHSIPIETIHNPEIEDGNIVRLRNGWYKFESMVAGERVYLTSLLIKHEYDYENKELINSFSNYLLPDFRGTLSLANEGFPVHNKYGKTIFSIVPLNEAESNTSLEAFIFFCYLSAFLILIQLLINAFQKVLISKPIILIIFPVIIVLIRYFWLKAEWLGPFQKFELFNPELFASESTPSLGDLIINISIFYLLVHFLLKRTRNWFKEGNQRMKLVIFVVPLFFASFWVAFEINSLIKTLVNDSQIKFDLEHLFDLDLYSFVSIAIIGAVFFTYFRLIQYIIIQFKKSAFEWNKLAFLWMITISAYILFDQFNSDHSILTSFWPVFLSGTLLWFNYKEKEYKFIHVISVLAFVSFYAAFILKEYSDNREREMIKSLAEIVATDRDIETEFEYEDIEKEIKETDFLTPYFDGNFTQNQLNDELESGPFNKLKKDFALTFYFFKHDGQMLEDFKNYDVNHYDRLIKIIRQSGEVSTISSNAHIYFVEDYTEKLTYLAHLIVTSGDSLHGHLFTEMRSKKFPEDIGLPSFLLEKQPTYADQLKYYSVAKYVDGTMVTGKGDYSYPLRSDKNFTSNGQFENVEGYNHFVYQEEGSRYKTIISKKLSSGWALFTSFSYLLIIFGVLLLIPLGFQQAQTEISLKNIKLNVKIQTVLIGLTLLTLVAFAFGAVTFVEQQYNEGNEGLIKEKITSVRTEIESKLKNEKVLKPELGEYLDFLLSKFSGIFLTDINLYSKDGDLLASSQPKIYSKGLLSYKMNPDAYYDVHFQDKSETVKQENIGSLNYLSAYVPVFNSNREMLAYLNVQYISRQGELENQISGFLLAIINIMVLMLALSTILAITISNRLTRPLKYIQDSLRSIQIGSVSKPIKYSGSDEIGELVKEYNKKVEELQINAEQLAKSERESAWREMAKQVAHEIKNPLTPMKLSIQHLKRSINLADDESKEKLDRVSKSLIEQIDALTQIANEFSNFAKMPKANEYEIDLIEILKNSATVFESEDGQELDMRFDMNMPAYIWADKDLLLRVFNNLIKNATQAIRNSETEKNGRKGLVEVHLEESADTYTVMIKDNGIGISEKEREKIFVPYFTTKSTGTGLGLAMSKQIVENLGGQIWFDSIPGEGTSFFVSFKKLNRN